MTRSKYWDCVLSLFCMFLLAVLLSDSAAGAQGGNLRIDNLRLVRWRYGPVRGSSQFLPGERVVVKFDINGITVSQAGGSSVDVELIWKDKTDRTLVHARGTPVTRNLLHGSIGRMVFLAIPVTATAGEYSLEIRARDNLSGSVVVDALPFTIVPKQFAIVNLRPALDALGKYERPTTFYVGEVLNVLFDIVGFAKQNDLCVVSTSFEILEGEQSLFKQEPATVFKNVIKPPRQDLLSSRFSFRCNRHGRFTLRIKVVDELTKAVLTDEIQIEVKSADAG